jgi:hypothetical protein
VTEANIVVRRFDQTDPRLGRHVEHDERSRSFAFNTVGLIVKDATHARKIPILDQGNLGSCTLNAGVGATGSDPLFDALPSNHPSLDENLAVKLYSVATKLDTIPGDYPPNDTGSTGLAAAKALQQAGLIVGYQHTFTLDDALRALQVTPVITGVTWYENFFYPDANGLITYKRGDQVAGGHEFVVNEVHVAERLVGCYNSWGESWGAKGKFYMSWDLWQQLLDDQGDVTVLLPSTAPAPTPSPTPVRTSDQADTDFAKANDDLSKAVKAYTKAYGYWKKARGL